MKFGLIWDRLCCYFVCLFSEMVEEVEGKSGEEEAGGGLLADGSSEKKINSTTALKIRYRAQY